MPAQETEKQRVERLKKQQIAARNPGTSKIRGYDWDKHNQKAARVKKKQQETPLLVEFWDLVPERWRGALYGLLFGLVIGAFLFIVVLGDDLKLLAAVPLILGGIIGYIVGKSTETKVS